MNIHQFRYAADNFGYVVHQGKLALAVDPGATDNILNFINTHNLKLEYVLNTHNHPDHTMGTQTVLDKSGAAYLDNRILINQGQIQLGEAAIKVHFTPGHTLDSICLQGPDFIITGDTLFNGTIGNCFSNDLQAFLESIRLLMSLPRSLNVYAGHDYVKDSIAFARLLEPNNPDLNRFLAAYTPDKVTSTLADEHRINPYFRFNEPAIIDLLNSKNLPIATENERWRSLMTL